MKLIKARKKSDLRDVFGIACDSLEQCITKGCEKLKINRSKEFKCLSLCDGVIIDDEDYFQALEKNTLIIFDTHKDTESAADVVCRTLAALRMDKKTADELMGTANSMATCSMQSLLVNIAQHGAGNSSAETRDEDPDWFKRVPDKKVRTKSEVLERSANTRVRSYYNEAKKLLQATELSAPQRAIADEAMKGWHTKLSKEGWYRCYFSRRKSHKLRFCDGHGWFTCEGDYLVSKCSSLHVINPYGSSESRAVFSQWNLDHQIEKARTVLPRLIKLIQSKPAISSKVNWNYFYDLMFTRNNLKLVHIACHIKQEHHEKKVDEKSVLLRSKR